MESVIKFTVTVALGVIFILSGIFRWEFPGILWYWREMKYGEIFNSIICILLGVMLVMAGIQFWIVR